MAADQVVSALAALGGVAVTLGGGALLETQRARHEHRRGLDGRVLEGFAGLVQTITEIARLMRTEAEILEEGRPRDSAHFVESIDMLVGTARRQAAMARLVCPASVVDIVAELETQLIPLHKFAVRAEETREGEHLVSPATGFFALRDQLVSRLRHEQGID